VQLLYSDSDLKILVESYETLFLPADIMQPVPVQCISINDFFLLQYSYILITNLENLADAPCKLIFIYHVYISFTVKFSIRTSV